MKKMLLMIGLVLTTAAANAQSVVTNVFNEVRMNIPATVRCVEGDAYGFMIEAQDAVVARAVSCSLCDGVMQFSWGNALTPGETEYDADTNTYSYGINTVNQEIRDNDCASELVITLISPALPAIKTSSDYVMVTLDADVSLADNL